MAWVECPKCGVLYKGEHNCSKKVASASRIQEVWRKFQHGVQTGIYSGFDIDAWLNFAEDAGISRVEARKYWEQLGPKGSSSVTVEEMRRALDDMKKQLPFTSWGIFEAAMYAAKTTIKDASQRRVFVQDFWAALNRAGLLFTTEPFLTEGYVYMEATSEHSNPGLKPILWHGIEYFAYGSLARPLEWLTIRDVIKSIPHTALTRLSRSIDYSSAEPYFNIVLSLRQLSVEEIKALELTPLEKLATATSSSSGFHVKYIDLTTGKTLEKDIADREQIDLYKLQREGKISIIDIHKAKS